MKTIILLLCFMVSSVHLIAQQQEKEMKQDEEIKLVQPEITKLADTDNDPILLSALTTLGDNNPGWKRERTMVAMQKESVSSGAVDNSLIYREKLAGIPFEMKAIFDEAEKLNSVEYAYSNPDRANLLDAFQSVTKHLNESFNAPTGLIMPPQEIRGEDLYLRGDLDSYHLEWSGLKTGYSLKLTPDKLLLICKPGRQINQ